MKKSIKNNKKKKNNKNKREKKYNITLVIEIRLQQLLLHKLLSETIITVYDWIKHFF